MQKLNTYEATPWVAGYQCCIVIYTFISFGLILVSVFNQSILMDSAPQFYSDWDNKFVEDLNIRESCQEGYVNLLNFTWPGTELGCDCTQSNGTGAYKYSNYYYMECSEFMLADNCQSVEPIYEKQFQHWPINDQSSVKAFKLCAKQSTETAIEAFQIEEASEGYKKCGNVYQVPSNESCPISDFSITTDSTGEAIGTTGLYLNIKRVQKEEVPLTAFTIGFNSICFSVSEIQQFQYLDKMINYNCYDNDERYVRFTSDMPYSDLLMVNEIKNEYNLLYKNAIVESRNVNLFYKYLTQFYYNSSQLCQAEDLDYIYNLNAYIKDNVMDVQLAAQVIVGIQAGVFGFLIPLMSAISLVGCSFKYTNLNRKSSLYKDLFGFWLGVKMIGETLCTIILAADMGYQQQMMNHFNDFINADCSDKYSLQEMSDFYNEYEIKVYNYVLLNFILCIIANVFDIYVTYLMCRDKHKEGIFLKNSETSHLKNLSSTHPDELLNRTKVRPQSEIKQQQRDSLQKRQFEDVEIPGDDMPKPHKPEN
ncbi:unnamed protein product [Paramecium octaurelia]|uniref:Transmembrane protein n=1 Tax=Paramecium octaurelia TaxID=43137 RepID=A0A8S1X560_PAROT|nr:unnamed protein product [Paramecium octaurelia]